jgi:hypothetical protein
MFTFLVKPTEPSPAVGDMGSVGAQAKMEYDDCDMTQSEPPDSEFFVPGAESPDGCRAVIPKTFRYLLLTTPPHTHTHTQCVILVNTLPLLLVHITSPLVIMSLPLKLVTSA